MSDVLGYLSEVTHRVSATFMPTEMEDVASFLRGDAWVLVSTHAAAADSGREPATTANPTDGNDAPPTLLRYPLGATRWGRCIPLGIAGTTLVSAVTSGSRAVLQNFFEGSGFAQVFTVHLVPTEQQQQQQRGGRGGGGSGNRTGVSTTAHVASSSPPSFQAGQGGCVGCTAASRKRRRLSTAAPPPAAHIVDVTLDGRYGSTAQAARHACMAVIRRWFEDLEDSLRPRDEEEEEAWKAPKELDERAAPQKAQLRRLLVLVHCCADNRAAVSTGAGRAPSSSYSSSTAVGGGAAPSPLSGSSGRRHRRGDDPLLSFLHDLAALATLYEARLSATACSVRPAVLLLPEDESYGGAMLKHRLKEEVGYRYWVQLFSPSDQHRHRQEQPPRQTNGGGSAGDASSLVRQRVNVGASWKASVVGGSAAHRNGLSQPQLHHRQGEAPLVRGCRLAAVWGVLDSSVLSAGADPADTDVKSLADPSLPVVKETAADRRTSSPLLFTHASASQLDEALRRHPACFFARPSNAPLCVFLMEALRRFPLLAPLAMLRHWQSTWTARHSLNDVLFVFHSTVCPFAMSAAHQDASTLRSSNNNGDGGGGSVLSTPSPSSLLRDATDLLDALLDASFTLAEDRDAVVPLSSNDFRIEQATWFMLMYEALTQQREARLRRIPGVVEVLLRLYGRHAGGPAVGAPTPSHLTTTTSTKSSTEDEAIRYAVRHLLPFAPLNVFYQAVQQCSAAPPPPPLLTRNSTAAKREVVAYPMSSLVLPLRRMSVALPLRTTTLLSLLPPDASLQELKGLAEQRWAAELPESWQKMVTQARGTQRRSLAALHASDSHDRHAGDSWMAASTQLSPANFFHPLVPHAVRVLYLLTAHTLHAPTEAAKQVPVVQLQVICQLTDEQLLLVLKELQTAGLVKINWHAQTARTLLDAT
ncbi:hypothetical protein ABB37_08336 [Leptomonas pyrrhocoris]|uniref:Uncharacterized protein n=1 Tax=Leptomonas pyrrhocoris TaxID=157538 RepID=A0A0M9FTL6_LEPPY|nr:hypothetical protein ABB37_08336 [Leptomonas pyrrhocoris]KPA75820.1 hypothetical protein ABB37_08336 [Leptomonas pyrrhocoris]|eukprot:XP_015654259.1 hypothetical protein ABB37_08336 [Leptomonas pyrrhocoris]